MTKSLLPLLIFTFFSFNLFSQAPFITTWETTTDNETVTIPTDASRFSYDYTVDWGDGTVESGLSGNVSHVYTDAGVHTISISGQFPCLSYSRTKETQILTIEQWGDIEWRTMMNAFTACRKLTYNATDAPDLSKVISLYGMFNAAASFDGDLSNWDVSNIRNFNYTFSGASSFNGDVSTWDMSGATGMINMFSFAYAFNQDISGWNVSSVTDMRNLFSSAESFNQDISGWDVSKVSNMSGMFERASSFNQDISNWDVSAAWSMAKMFYGLESFNQDISGWNVGSVTDMSYMFSETSFNQDIGNWDVSSVQNMAGMFEYNSVFNQNLNNWNVSAVKDMSSMFKGASAFNQNLNNWNVSAVEKMFDMFFNANAFSGDVSSWDVSNVTDMRGMFFGNYNFNADISAWDVSEVIDMNSMFHYATNFNQNISDWDVAKVRNFSSMFRSARAFNQDLGKWDMSLGTNMTGMFYDANAFNGDIKAWNVSNVKNFKLMFYNAGNFNQNLSDWDVSSATNMSQMFHNSYSFNGDISNWDVSNVKNFSYMFTSAQSFNQDLSNWDIVSANNFNYMFQNAKSFNANVGQWEVNNITSMFNMFVGAQSFNQNLGNWDITSAGNIGNQFLYGTNLSVENYDSTLQGWASLENLQVDLSINFTDLNYCNAETARNQLINDYNWAITGDSKNCSNLPPSGIKLSSQTISEGNSAGAVIGEFSSSDRNENDTHTYSLVAGTGDTDNSIFSISENQLLVDNVLDYNVKNTYSIRVQTDDGNGGVFSKQFTIEVLKETVLEFPALTSKTFGDPEFELVASSNSPEEINFSSSDNSIVAVSGNEAKIISAGEVTITASQLEGDEFSASELTQQFVVERAEQTITPSLPNSINYQDSLIIAASNNTFLPINFSASDANLLSIYDPSNKENTDITIILRPGFNPELINWNLRKNGEIVAENIPLGSSDYEEVSRDLSLPDGEYSFFISGVSRSNITIKKGTEILFNEIHIYSPAGTEFTIKTETSQKIAAVGVGSVNIEINSEGGQNYLPAQIIHPLTINKIPQTIDFDPLANKTYGDSEFELTATTNSELPITFSSSDDSVASIIDNVVTIHNAGTVEITATQEGNDFYAADSIFQTLTVNKAPQTITFASLPEKEYGDDPFTLAATSDAGLDVSFSSSDQSVATISGDTLNILTAGYIYIYASQSGNENYQPATSVRRSLRISKIRQTIDLEPVGTKRYGDAPFTLNATSSAGLPVTFSSGDESIFTVNDNVVTIVGSGSTSLIVSQSGNVNYIGTTSYRSFTVYKATQSIIFDPIPDKTYGNDSFELNATGGESENPVQFTSLDETVATISGNMVTIVGAGTVEIRANQDGNENYNASYISIQELTVNKAEQTIDFNALSNKTFGDPSFELSSTGGASGNEITYTSSDESVATISGNTVTILAAGNTNITASQSGNENYLAADHVVQEFTVNKASQSISFDALSDKTYGEAAFELTATSDAGLPVIYESSDESVATITDNTVTILSAGTTNITASQNGNENYLPAADVAQELTVLKAAQSISFDALQDKTYGDDSFNLTATSESGLPITYTSSDAMVATITDNTVTILSGGTANITASQIGNDNYQAANDVVQEFTINKADQSISFDALSDRVFGDAAFELTATTDSGLPVLFESSDETVATIDDNIVTILTAGATTITVSQSGNENYNSAANVSQELIINKADQEITVEEIGDKEVDAQDFEVVASTDSGLELTYAVLSGPANLNGNVVSLTGEAGAVEIEVSQSGNLNFNPESVMLSFDVIDLCAGFDATVTVIQNVSCFEGANGSFEVTLNNGTAPFIYSLGSESQEDNGLFDGQSAGSYEITVTDANGCATIAFVEITQPDLIVATAEISDSNTTDGNGSISLTVTGGTGNYSYEWSNGATEANLSGLSIGEYSVTVSDDANCTITETFSVGGVTSNDSEIQSVISIYPNPTSGQVNVIHPSTVKLIKLYDAYGRLIDEQLPQTEQTVFDVKTLSSGLYFIQLDNGKLNRIVKK